MLLNYSRRPNYERNEPRANIDETYMFNSYYIVVKENINYISYSDCVFKNITMNSSSLLMVRDHFNGSLEIKKISMINLIASE